MFKDCRFLFKLVFFVGCLSNVATCFAISYPSRVAAINPIPHTNKSPADALTTTYNDSRHNTVLIIQNADLARLTADKKHPGKFKLIMYGVKRVLAYSDRKPIFIGRFNNDDFVSFWNNNIKPYASTTIRATIVSNKFSPMSTMGVKGNFFLVTNPNYSVKNKAYNYTVAVKGDLYLKAGIYHDVTLFLMQKLDAKKHAYKNNFLFNKTKG